MGGELTRDPAASRTGWIPYFQFCFPWDRARGRANNLGAKFLNGVFLGLRLGTNEVHIGTATGVVRAETIKRETVQSGTC